MPSWEEPYITLHIVWHPRCEESAAAAAHLSGHFTRDLYSVEEMGVDVFEWSSPPQESPVPPTMDLDSGDAIVVVVLIGDELQRDPGWSDYVVGLARRCRSSDTHVPQRRLFPVAVTPGNLSTDLGVQALRWHSWEPDGDSRSRRLVREVTYETSRMLRTMLVDDPDLTTQMNKVRVFLSHSKHDPIGEQVAKRIRDWLQNDVQLSVFLDVTDIPAGLPSDQVLEQGVRDSAVLVVYSDSFSSREWCRREVLVGKETDRPIVVADCIEDLDERAFPYLVNVPIVRLCSRRPNRFERVVGRLLDEVFKNYLWRCRTASLRQDNPDAMFVTRAPELLTLANITINFPQISVLVYPDPPLGLRELELLDIFRPDVRSFSEWMSEAQR